MGFTKLDDGLIFSSILTEDDAVFKVWVLILSRTDGDGIARISPAFLASVTRKADEEVERCLRVLESPDPRSRSLNDDGRRVERVDGGYKVLNYLKYRKKAETEDVRQYERERKARQREGRSLVPVVSRTEAGPSASASPSGVVSVEEGSGEKQAIPPEQRAEDATRQTIVSLQSKFGSLIARLSEHPQNWEASGPRRMVPAWCRECTGYTRKDGTSVRGVADYRTVMSIDRLENSIADAEWHLAELDKGVKRGA